jgi:3-phosphoshikimate 1-carboxyvinyltransferase
MDVKDCFVVRPGAALRGRTTVPGDKSISHRAVMFGALATGATQVRGWLSAGDTLATLASIRALGVQIERHNAHTLTIHGGTLSPSAAPLDLVNAGTGIRLLAGIMAGQPFSSVLDGSSQLRRRPMKRILEPLRLMGADITATDGSCPLHVRPATLKGIDYTLPMASAQVKSAVLLAALFAEGPTIVRQPGPARDHTERMLGAMGADLTQAGDGVTLRPGAPLHPMDFTVPGDSSSAAFLAVGGCVVPDSDLQISGVNLNPTRTGIFEALQMMGADLTVTETGTEAGDPVGVIHARYGALRGVEIGGALVVRMIDEFPVLMVAALCAEGTTIVRDAQELRVKETDRLAVMTTELRKMGAVIVETSDGFRITGPQKLAAARVFGHDDHRISMSLTIAALTVNEPMTVLDAECAADSFPGYAETLAALGADVHVSTACGED